jgi:hypothetical protein
MRLIFMTFLTINFTRMSATVKKESRNAANDDGVGYTRLEKRTPLDAHASSILLAHPERFG